MIDNSQRKASWEQIAKEFQSERDGLQRDLLRVQQERDDAIAQRNFYKQCFSAREVRALVDERDRTKAELAVLRAAVEHHCQSQCGWEEDDLCPALKGLS
jgi:oligoendopeptidase F